MASGHVALNLATAIDKFIHGRRAVMAIDPGERSGRFLQNGRSHDDRTSYTANRGPSANVAIVY